MHTRKYNILAVTALAKQMISKHPFQQSFKIGSITNDLGDNKDHIVFEEEGQDDPVDDAIGSEQSTTLVIIDGTIIMSILNTDSRLKYT